MSRLWLALLAAGALLAAALGGDREPDAARPLAVSTGGSLTISNSRAGMPVFTAANVGPGDSASGTVTVANTGSRSGFVWLSQRGLTGVPGALGGYLPGRLRLEVLDVTAPAAPSPVYSGPFAAMAPRPLGHMAPGARRTYRFTATFPAGGAGADNAFAGSSASVTYVWTGTEGSTTGRADTLPPRLRLSFPPVQRILSGRRLVVRARCDESCRLDVRGALRTGTARAGVRPLRARRLLAGRTARLTVRIPARGMRLLRRALTGRRQASLRLSFSANDHAGNRAHSRRTIRLTPRRAPRTRQARAARELEVQILSDGRTGRR